MKKKILFLALSLALLAALAACKGEKDAAGNSGMLRVGVRTDIYGVSTYNGEADTYYGFEADLARELAREMGYRGAYLMGVDSSTREALLESGHGDCLVASYSYSEERTEKFALSRPYYVDSGYVMVECSTLFEDYPDLRGTAVAFRRGTTAKRHFEEKLFELGLIAEASDEALAGFVRAVEMDSYDEMDEALESGEVDAFCGDGTIVLPRCNAERTVFAEPFSTESYVVASLPGGTLAKRIDAAIAELQENGVIDELESKWGI